MADPLYKDLLERMRATIVSYPDWPKSGINFLDINPLIRDRKLISMASVLMMNLETDFPTAVVGIESRGFIFSSLITARHQCDQVLCRKAGKLPGPVYAQSYDLEYGQATLEIQANALRQGDKVLIVDDVLATGGTAMAAVNLCRQFDVEILGVSVLIELEFLEARLKLEAEGVPVYSVLTY